MMQCQNKKNDIWYLYIVRCQNDSLYTGIAKDVNYRIDLHNSGKGAKAVKMMGLPVKLVYKEKIGSLGEALKKERIIKKLSKVQKENLIKK